MHRVTRTAFAVGTACALGLLGYQAGWGGRSHRQPPLVSYMASAVASPAAFQAQSPARSPPESMEFVAAAPGVESRSLIEVPSVGEDKYGLFTNDVRGIFNETPALARFAYFQQHVLLDVQGKQRYHGLLSDAALFRGVRQDLLFPQEFRANHQGQIRRFMGIDAIREALAWPENPQRPSVLSLVEEVLLADNIRPALPLDLRQSLAANKIELYEILQSEEPTRAAYVVERSRNTKQEALIDYIVEQVRLGQAYLAASGVNPPASSQISR